MKKSLFMVSLLLIAATLLFFTACDPTELTFILTIEKDGEGTVSPAVGNHSHIRSAVVNLEATPAEGWSFSHWVGDVSNNQTAATTILMDADKTVKAVFAQETAPGQHTLTIEKEGEGAVSPNVGSHVYDEGETVNLVATPAEDWSFSHWVGDVANTQSPTTTTVMNSNKTVKAVFAEEAERTVYYIDYSNINEPETWVGHGIYVIERNISVNAHLTIEPGAIIKFEIGTRMIINSDGRLQAEGLATKPIIFTSIQDDEHGGDTNQDGSFTTPAPGDWQLIRLEGTSVLDYCEFYYGGSGGTYGDSTLLIEGNGTVRNSIFAYNTGHSNGALDARSGATIEGNTFFSNVKPMRLNVSLDLDDSNMFHNPEDPNEQNEYQGIFIDGTTLNGNTTWEETEAPFVFRSSLSIRDGARLTLKEGVIVKLNWTRILVDGTLIAKGLEGQPIIFTSYYDDERGGDSSGDEGFTLPNQGDWQNIVIRGNGSFDYCEFYYGGGGGTYGDSALRIDASATVENSIFAYNNGFSDGALDARAGATIKNNTFYGNTKPMSFSPSLDLDDSNIFHNPANPSEVNTFQGIFINGTSLSSNATWEETEAPFVIRRNLSVGDGFRLTLKEGVMVKFDDTRMLVDGNLLASGAEGQPIIFTSYKDDARGGDSNGDGGDTYPEAGNWHNIVIRGNGAFDYCEFYYGGGGGTYGDSALRIDSTTTVENSTFAYNGGFNNGALDARSSATIKGNTFYSNSKPLTLGASLSLDNSNTFHNPADPNERNQFEGIFINGTSISNDVEWKETEIAFVIGSSFTIGEAHRLTLGDSVTLKFQSSVRLNHNNNLLNHDGQGVSFTSYRDDTRGGDSNGDGDDSYPEEGDWQGIRNAVGSYYEEWDNIFYAASP